MKGAQTIFTRDMRSGRWQFVAPLGADMKVPEASRHVLEHSDIDHNVDINNVLDY